ncbi:MAG: MoaD/ThiS family protein [Candidatus Aenigmarchaeota archaeon]|nr:MoaD/ThiS family protein [Candidatus Aenigmarchaeota archaeon]
MEVCIDGKACAVKDNATVSEALKETGLNPEIFLAKRNGAIIHENEVLRNNDRISLIKVISGG